MPTVSEKFCAVIVLSINKCYVMLDRCMCDSLFIIFQGSLQLF